MVESISTTCILTSAHLVTPVISQKNSVFGVHSKRRLPIPAAIPQRFSYTNEITRVSPKTLHLLNMLHEVEPVSYAHSVNLAAHTYNFAKFLRLGKNEINDLYYGALLHDIGKLYYKDLLLTPRKLTPDEVKKVQEHVIASYILLSKNHYSRFARIAALYHHYNPEKYPTSDASLYLKLMAVGRDLGLSTSNIELIRYESLTKRESYLLSIISLLDVFDALIDINRPYKPGIPLQEIVRMVNPFWGTKFSISLKSTFLQYALWLMHYPQPFGVPSSYAHLERSW